MLKRETFKQAMQAICTQEMYVDQLNAIYRKATDGQGMLVLDGTVHAALLKTLADAMEDEYQYIEWWLYDAPEDDKVVSWEDNGSTVSVDLADVDALYDFLVKSADERRNIKRDNPQHKSLRQRAATYEGHLNLADEYDWQETPEA